MRNPFWKSASVLLNYKRQLVLALAASLLSAVSLGAGLGTTRSAFQLLLGEHESAGELINFYLPSAKLPRIAGEGARALTRHAPADRFWSFLIVMALVLLLGIIGIAGRYLYELLTTRVALKAAALWRSRVFERLLHVPVLQMSRIGTGDPISRLVSDTTVLASGYSAVLTKTMGDLLRGLAGLCVAFALDWQLTMIALVCLPAILFLVRMLGDSIRRKSGRTLKQYGQLVRAAQAALLGIQVVKIHQAEEYEKQRFARANRSLLSEEMSLCQTKAMASPVAETLTIVFVTAAACVAAWHLFRHNAEPANFMTVLLALAVAGQSVKPLTRLVHKVNEASAAAERLLEITKLPVESSLCGRMQAPDLPRHSRSISFEGVGFTYPGRDDPAIQNINFTVEHGATVAIVGANGAGKTTLLNLLPRLIQPTRGRVRIDGFDISEVSLSSLRQQIAVVPQETVLFEGTIAENIGYGRSDVAMETVIEAARAAYAHDFIMQLPRQYLTELAELGSGLSSGQKQRVAIARAILRDPAILILDEANSQIDPESEEKINRALRELKRERTVFIIAHRLTTVLDADIIAVMEKGRIVDVAGHHELLRRCAGYRGLVGAQLRLASRIQLTN